MIFIVLAGLTFITGCEPNEELYEDLDRLRTPYSKSIEYVITTSDYNFIGDEVATHQAFTGNMPAMENVPRILARNFLALNLGSSAMVTYDALIEEPIWYEAGFGYELTDEDYTDLGIADTFSADNPAEDNLPVLLRRQHPGASEGTEQKLIYNFREGPLSYINIDTYVFDGDKWVLKQRREDIPFVGYELGPEDYEHFGGAVEQYNNFSDSDPAEMHLPVWLKNKYPYAIIGTEKVVKYRVFSGGTFTEIAHYTFNGLDWEKSSYIETVSEQYVFGDEGWAFDPTTRFIMGFSDYMHLAEIDPIPHPQYDDFGYYYGASAFYTNFDMRLEARRVQKNEDGDYFDEDLGAIFDNESREATVDEMFRRIVEEGIKEVLKNRYPDAQPQAGGIDVHYIVGFETYNDNFSRSHLEAEYRCVSAGDPPVFELIEGPRERE